GTTSWSISGITLSNGDNIITITARDRANNTNSDTITVSIPQTTMDATALYNFNEESGTIATDSSGNGNNGTIYGASWTTGRSGDGLSFDGANDYVNLGDPLSLQPNTVSVSVWFKTTDSNGIILRKRPYGYGLEVRSSGRISFWIYNSAATLFRAISPIAYNDNAWHHAVGVYDGSRVRLYIDSVQVASASAGTICYTAGGIAIGRDGNFNGSYFSGLVDELGIYNRALSNFAISESFTRDDLLMHIGALKKEAGRDFRLVTISIPKPQEPVNENTFRFSLDRERLRQAYRREGRYLLRSNMQATAPETVWENYLLLTRIEQAFKDLKGSLSVRPLWHQLERRIEAHIFVSFLAFCLHTTLRNLARGRAGGLTSEAILEKLSGIQMIDVHLPTTDDRHIVMSRYTCWRRTFYFFWHNWD
ncbi:MAG: hypothetical protein BROFUL_02927, partial [Candidatus Brocadia fulgida]